MDEHKLKLTVAKHCTNFHHKMSVRLENKNISAADILEFADKLARDVVVVAEIDLMFRIKEAQEKDNDYSAKDKARKD